MYPQIKHLLVEQTTVFPSVFSRYEIHSVPSLLIMKQTTQTRYHGPKDLTSLTNFYKRTTGLDPVVVGMVADASPKFERGQNLGHAWNRGSVKEILWREPFLVVSIVFVLLRVFLFFFPEIVTHIKAIWVAYVPLLIWEYLESRSSLLDSSCI